MLWAFVELVFSNICLWRRHTFKGAELEEVGASLGGEAVIIVYALSVEWRQGVWVKKVEN